MPPLETLAALILVGLVIGAVAGMVGIGGGVLVVPVLMLFFGLTRQNAAATSLALFMLPVGVLAVLTYSGVGSVNWWYTGFIAVGYVFGAWLGARLVTAEVINETALRVLFGLLLVYVAGRLLFRPDGRAGAAWYTMIMVAAAAIAYGFGRLMGHRWKKMPYAPAIYQDRQRQPFEHEFDI